MRDKGIKPIFGKALMLACLLAAVPKLHAQAQDSNAASGSDKNKPAANSQSPDAAQQPDHRQTQTNANPFPDDTTNIPVMPTRDTIDLPPGVAGKSRIDLPVDDVDPVRSPEDEGAAAQSGEQNSSSSMAGMSDLLPGPDDETQPGKRNKKGTQIAPEHHETAAEDEDVGSYYLDNKNWRAALSRYQSAMVLDPDNPEVYWGLAESQRHLGDLANARANYKKVVDYDPDSRHGKEARKALSDPEIANAKPQASAQPSAPSQ